MIKTLTRHGNSLALVIDRAILEMLNIDAGTELELTTDGRTLLIAPRQSAEHRRKVSRALAKINRKYGADLRRLAE